MNVDILVFVIVVVVEFFGLYFQIFWQYDCIGLVVFGWMFGGLWCYFMCNIEQLCEVVQFFLEGMSFFVIVCLFDFEDENRVLCDCIVVFESVLCVEWENCLGVCVFVVGLVGVVFMLIGWCLCWLIDIVFWDL